MTSSRSIYTSHKHRQGRMHHKALVSTSHVLKHSSCDHAQTQNQLDSQTYVQGKPHLIRLSKSTPFRHPSIVAAWTQVLLTKIYRLSPIYRTNGRCYLFSFLQPYEKARPYEKASTIWITRLPN